MKSLTWRTAFVALAVTAAALTLTAAPAHAAEPEQHCVVPITNIDNVTCFDTLDEAIEFGSRGAGLTPGKDAAARTSGARVAAAAVAPVIVATEFDGLFYTGSSLSWVGFSGNCTTATGNIDYQVSSMPAGWSNRISSFRVYANCWQNDFDLTNWGGYSTGYRGSQAIVNATINNDTSSQRWS